MKSYSCPICHSKLQVNKLSCPSCKAEFPQNEELSPYDYLTDSQSEFLELFLRARGNLKTVGKRLNLSYPAVKRRLDQLLSALNFSEESCETEEKIDMSIFQKITSNSTLASDIVKMKLRESNGVAIMPLFNGEPCRIAASADGKYFTSEKLPGQKMEYEVFDIIVELLKHSTGHRAPKGNSYNKEDKVGFGNCTPDTVVGTVAVHYYGKKQGESCYDPIFVLAAVLEWAGIAKNGRGYMELTADYCGRAGIGG